MSQRRPFMLHCGMCMEGHQPCSLCPEHGAKRPGQGTCETPSVRDKLREALAATDATLWNREVNALRDAARRVLDEPDQSARIAELEAEVEQWSTVTDWYNDTKVNALRDAARAVLAEPDQSARIAELEALRAFWAKREAALLHDLSMSKERELTASERAASAEARVRKLEGLLAKSDAELNRLQKAGRIVSTAQRAVLDAMAEADLSDWVEVELARREKEGA